MLTKNSGINFLCKHRHYFSNPLLSNPNLTKYNFSRSTKTSKFIAFCNSQITYYGRLGNLKEAESVFDRMPLKNIISWTAMLTAYAENGQLENAKKLFDEMPQRNIATWNAMITAYIRCNLQIVEAFKLFSMMPKKNSISQAAMITGFAQAGMLSEAQRLYSEMSQVERDPIASNALISGYLRIGELEEAIQVFDGMMERNVVSWSSMIDGYCKNGRVGDAKELFEKMPERNVVSWTAMISGYLKFGQWEDGIRLFLQMRKERNIKVNSMTLSVILDACANLCRFREGIQIHGLAISMGFEHDAFLGNSTITMYCKVGWMDVARKMFDIMDKKNIVSWNSLIAGYVQNGDIGEACLLFKTIPNRDVVSWTTMISGLSNEGRMEESITLFREMPEKDDIAWTTIISGFVANGEYETAFNWFINMIRETIKPNTVTLSSVIGASAGLAILNLGEQIHAHVVKMDKESELSVLNSLISMYGRCGNIRNAYQIFTIISTPNIVSMNSMITAFSQHGHGKEAQELFRNMLKEGYEPNQITFLGVLSSCAHVGLVEEGWYHFKSMSSLYHIKPEPEHYACMVDLLGRAGLLKEAVDLIHTMPCQQHLGVWGALLSASRTHMDLSLAKLAAKRILELEPENATAYVVLSNMYSIAGLKNYEEEVRTVKRNKRLRKDPGCSWITVRNKVHLFLAGDKSHMKFKEIDETLRMMVKEISSIVE